MDLLGQRSQQDVVDQRGLARAGHPGHRHQPAEGEVDVDVVQVVLAGTLDREHVPAPGPSDGGDGDGLGPGDVLAGQRVGIGLEAPGSGDRARVHDAAAVLPRARPDVDHVVGDPDGLLVVLDHDDRVAQVAEPLQRPDEPLVVALVEPDGRLVQHVEHPDQAAADLAGQPDALGLTAGQGGRRAGQGQVVEPHVRAGTASAPGPRGRPGRR